MKARKAIATPTKQPFAALLVQGIGMKCDKARPKRWRATMRWRDRSDARRQTELGERRAWMRQRCSWRAFGSSSRAGAGKQG